MPPSPPTPPPSSRDDFLNQAIGGATLPAYKFVSNNINGMSYNQTGGSGTRKGPVMSLVQSLTERNDITWLQQTNLLEQEIKQLENELEGTSLYGNCRTVRQGGVLVIIKNKILELYNIGAPYASDTQDGKGRILSIPFTPKKKFRKKYSSFRSTGAYLSSGNTKKATEGRYNQLMEIADKIPRDTDFEFLTGDFNFDNSTVTGTVKAAYEHMLDKRGLQECHHAA